MIHDAAELISLALTPATIIFSLVVVLLWGPEAWRALGTPSSQRSSHQWFILGVAVGFVGSAIDNAYWGLAWSAAFIESEYASDLFMCGVYSNIWARQIAGAYAGYCHARSYYEFSNGKNAIKGWVRLSGVVGVAYVSALVVWKISGVWQ